MNEKKIKLADQCMPKRGERYFAIDSDGSIFCFIWADMEEDHDFFHFGNCFSTREEAYVMAEKIKKLLKDEKTLTKYYVTFFTGEGYTSNTFDIKTLDLTAIDRLYDWCEKKTGVKGNIINITKLEI